MSEEHDTVGEITDRWRILHKGRTEVPMWYRVLDRFGLPTLMTLALLVMGWVFANRFLDNWTKVNEGYIAAINGLANKVQEVIVAMPLRPKEKDPTPERSSSRRKAAQPVRDIGGVKP
jgi:hypothetical protein